MRATQLSIVDNENTSVAQTDIDFESAFWVLWAGKRINKKLARMNYDRLHVETKLAAVVGAATWRPYWLTQEWRFLPDPMRWIIGECWDDEPPTEIRQTNAAHVPMEASEPFVRGAMPEHVKTLIAKLRGK